MRTPKHKVFDERHSKMSSTEWLAQERKEASGWSRRNVRGVLEKVTV